MAEQKRPVLTLKRKTEGETPVRSRKTIINVTTPPKWKVKKEKMPMFQLGIDVSKNNLDLCLLRGTLKGRSKLVS